MGDAETNLRIKVVRELIDDPDFDVGLQAAIQTIQEDDLDLMKPKLSVAEWSPLVCHGHCGAHSSKTACHCSLWLHYVEGKHLH